jgi:hypothetical protein
MPTKPMKLKKQIFLKSIKRLSWEERLAAAFGFEALEIG